VAIKGQQPALKGKNMLQWTFLDVPMIVFFMGESSIVALLANLFEKLGKSEMKN